jgi:hypothetical protein
MVRVGFVKALLAQACLGSFFTTATNLPYHSNLGPRGSAACQRGENRDVVAPKENIWAGISTTERSALECYILQWADRNTGILQPNHKITNTSHPRLSGSSFGLGTNATRGSWNQTHPPVFTNGTQSQEGSCDRPQDAGFMLSYIDLIYPNKSDALAYIQANGPTPPRYAKFVLTYSEDDVSDTRQKFSIGPLPVSPNVTKIERMDYDATRSRGGKIKTVRRRDQSIDAESLLANITLSMKDILEDLVGANATAQGPRNQKPGAAGENVEWVCLTSPSI